MTKANVLLAAPPAVEAPAAAVDAPATTAHAYTHSSTHVCTRHVLFRHVYMHVHVHAHVRRARTWTCGIGKMSASSSQADVPDESTVPSKLCSVATIIAVTVLVLAW